MSRQFSQRFEKYVRAARYGFDRDSLQAYTQAQDIIFKAECDLSAYRLRYQDVPHVVIVGLKPTLELDARLSETLASGQAAELPRDIVTTLLERRYQAKRIGPWVEGHYRPGRPM